MRKPALMKIIYGMLISFFLFVIASCDSGLTYNNDFPTTINNTSTLIKEKMTEFNIVGLSIALVDGNKIVWATGFGEADKEKGIAASKDTVYMLGSISKTLTSVALL